MDNTQDIASIMEVDGDEVERPALVVINFSPQYNSLLVLGESLGKCLQPIHWKNWVILT